MVDFVTEKLKFSKGEIIAKEGDFGTQCFVLLDGWVGVFKNAVKVDEFNAAGSVFGEMSMLLQRHRTATLLALADCEILALRGELEDLIKCHPNIAKKILVALADRLRKTTENFCVVSEPDYLSKIGAEIEHIQEK